MRHFNNIIQLIESNSYYYHGSMTKLPIGTILIPSHDYEEKWGNTGFYEMLEKYRPSNKLSHRSSVFLCDNPDDIDLAGGGTEYLFTVIPNGIIEKHDMNWSSEISCLLDDGNEELIKKAAFNYWNGIPHHDESVWEYLTPTATIIKVEYY